MDALILVDIQYDFLPGGSLAVPHGDDIIPVALAAMSRADLVVATQDWHPPEHQSFAANHPGRAVGDLIDLHGLEQVLWPTHCVQGSRGADLVDDLPTERIARVFPKGTDPAVDSYSGFFDNGRRGHTGMADYLRDRGISRVYLLGLATDYCVKFTALDACSLGFETHLIEPGCRGVNLSPGDSAQAIEDMRGAGVHIHHSSDDLPMTKPA